MSRSSCPIAISKWGSTIKINERSSIISMSRRPRSYRGLQLLIKARKMWSWLCRGICWTLTIGCSVATSRSISFERIYTQTFGPRYFKMIFKACPDLQAVKRVKKEKARKDRIKATGLRLLMRATIWSSSNLNWASFIRWNWPSSLLKTWKKMKCWTSTNSGR